MRPSKANLSYFLNLVDRSNDRILFLEKPIVHSVQYDPRIDHCIQKYTPLIVYIRSKQPKRLSEECEKKTPLDLTGNQKYANERKKWDCILGNFV